MNRALFNALIESAHPLRQNLMEFDTEAMAKKLGQHLQDTKAKGTHDVNAARPKEYTNKAGEVKNRKNTGSLKKRTEDLQAKLAAHPEKVEKSAKAGVQTSKAGEAPETFSKPNDKFKYKNDDGGMLPKMGKETKGHIDLAMSKHAEGKHGEAVGHWGDAIHSAVKNNKGHAAAISAVAGAAGISHLATKHVMRKGFEDAVWKYGVPAVGGAAAVGYLAGKDND